MPTTLEQAREGFASRPERSDSEVSAQGDAAASGKKPPASKRNKALGEAIDGVSAVAVDIAHGKLPTGYTATDAKAVALAERTKRKYAVTAKGRDAILLFGKYKRQKVSALAGTIRGRDYLRWMLVQEFEPKLLEVIRACLSATV